MLDLLNSGILSVMDFLLGWLLYLPTDVVLLAVAVGTAALMTVVRLFTTNQDLLGRCSDDKKRLKELMREAKKSGDKSAQARYRATQGAIGVKVAKAEGRPLLAVIIPIAILGTWAFQRIAYVPPRADEPVEVVFYVPVSAEGQIVHLVPMDGTEAETGWIQKVTAVLDEGPAHGLATWTLRAEPRGEPYGLRFRYKGETYHKALLVGQRTYAPPVKFYENDQVMCSEVHTREAKFLGVVPGIPWLGIQPWLVAYFLIAIPSVLILKRILGIY